MPDTTSIKKVAISAVYSPGIKEQFSEKCLDALRLLLTSYLTFNSPGVFVSISESCNGLSETTQRVP